MRKTKLLFLLVIFGSIALAEPLGVQPGALDVANLYALTTLEPQLTGNGVGIAVICRSFTYADGQPLNDYRPQVNHPCLAGKSFDFVDSSPQTAGISPHSTKVCSILFGIDPKASIDQLGNFSYRGAAPDVNAVIYEFWHFLSYKVFNAKRLEADVLNMSMGSPFEDWWTRGIEALVERDDLVAIAAIGNGVEASDSALYPAASSNVVGVGVVNSAGFDLASTLKCFELAHPESSSAGPSSKGLCKPDIVAPGNCLTASEDGQTYAPTGDWASFATPVVSGTAALLIQKIDQIPALEPARAAEAIKAILLNSAQKLPFWHKGKLTKEDDKQTPLDMVQGAGMVDALAAYNTLIAGKQVPGPINRIGWDVNYLSEQTPAMFYRLNVDEPNRKMIKITAAWKRHFEHKYPFNPILEKDADLRLELWQFDNASQAYILRDYCDSATDNLEHIYYSLDPNSTEYEIVVTYSPNSNPVEHRFALAWEVIDEPSLDDIRYYDLNCDGVVDEVDLGLLMQMVKEKDDKADFTSSVGDINSDGVLDVHDVKLLTDHFNRKAPWAAGNN